MTVSSWVCNGIPETANHFIAPSCGLGSLNVSVHHWALGEGLEVGH